MAWGTTKGFCFRATSGYVTDPTNTTYVIPTDVYPTTRSVGGENVTFGWDAWSGAITERDRNTGAPYELAGLHFIDAATLTRYFRVDVEPGTYRIQFASGDRGGNPSKSNMTVKDGVGGTTRLTLQDSAIGDGAFIDATGTEHANAAAWDASGRVWSATFTVTGTAVAFYLEGDATYTNPSIVFINIEQMPATAAPLLLLSTGMDDMGNR